MKHLYVTFIILTVIFSIVGCGKFVQAIDPPISTVDDNLLNSEDQTQFVVNGVWAQFEDAYGMMSTFGDALSDELFFDRRIQEATYPTYADIDNGTILLDNQSVIDAEGSLGRFRLYADTLVARVAKIQYKDTKKRDLALYTGYLFGGIARYCYASYFAITQDSGGGVIDLSAFIPSMTMYDLAIDRLKQAIPHAASPDQARIVHTIIARIYLIKGDYANALTEAQQGMTSGDASMDAQYSSEASNFWWITAGPGRDQFGVAQRFVDYVNADPKEASRIQIIQTATTDTTVTFYMQNKYSQDASPIPFTTWQENELILGELAIRSNDNAGGITHVNAVRASHGLDARSATALDSIYVERDKELFCTGNRLNDQHRFNRWHLAPGTWEYLPITARERSANSNLH